MAHIYGLDVSPVTQPQYKRAQENTQLYPQQVTCLMLHTISHFKSQSTT